MRTLRAFGALTTLLLVLAVLAGCNGPTAPGDCHLETFEVAVNGEPLGEYELWVGPDGCTVPE